MLIIIRRRSDRWIVNTRGHRKVWNPDSPIGLGFMLDDAGWGM